MRIVAVWMVLPCLILPACNKGSTVPNRGDGSAEPITGASSGDSALKESSRAPEKSGRSQRPSQRNSTVIPKVFLCLGPTTDPDTCAELSKRGAKRFLELVSSPSTTITIDAAAGEENLEVRGYFIANGVVYEWYSNRLVRSMGNGVHRVWESPHLQRSFEATQSLSNSDLLNAAVLAFERERE